MSKKKSSPSQEFEIPQLERKIKLNRKHKLTEKQKNVLQTILDEDSRIIIMSGAAGTSKTYLAVYAALQEIINKKDKQLIYIRSLVENSSKKMGHLPGSMGEKFFPFMNPLLDKMEEFLSPQDSSFLKENDYVDALPINYLRGHNWVNKIIIVDECQNITEKEFTTILTRASEGTKIIMCGDLMQSDIGNNGFSKVCEIFSDEESANMGIYNFHFNENDIVRSELVKFIVKKMQKEL